MPIYAEQTFYYCPGCNKPGPDNFRVERRVTLRKQTATDNLEIIGYPKEYYVCIYCNYALDISKIGDKNKK